MDIYTNTLDKSSRKDTDPKEPSKYYRDNKGVYHALPDFDCNVQLLRISPIKKSGKYVPGGKNKNTNDTKIHQRHVGSINRQHAMWNNARLERQAV